MNSHSSVSAAANVPTSAASYRLADIRRSSDEVGDRIYEGRVYSLDATRTEPLFRYDRRVRAVGGDWISTHITQDPLGDVVVVQAAEHDSAYGVKRAAMTQRQSGLDAAVEVEGGRAVFTVTKGGRVHTSTERVTDPLVAGPTMFGFIVTHWDALAAGRRVPIRFAVLERGESIRFVLEMVPSGSDRATIRMTPSNLLVRLVVRPTYFHFEPTTRRVLGYDGRVPPLERVNGKLRTLDARVLYTFHTASFR